jgi:phosphonate transport system permease protein
MTGPLQIRAMAVAPRAMRGRWSDPLVRYVAPVVVLAIMVAMAVDLDMAPSRLLAGIDKLGRFAVAMFPPSDGGDLPRILRSLAETFAMAFAGTVLAVLAAAPLGLIGAKTVMPNKALHFAFRRFLDVFRGVPVLVWALILVTAFGLGPFGGVIALALADVPTLAKLFAEAVENVDEGPMEGVRSAGVPPLVEIRYGLAPQVAPVWASQALFFLEGNFRNAAVLGLVGAGGIGFELEERIRIFAFDEVAFIILLYMVAVAGLDTLSRELRKKLA